MKIFQQLSKMQSAVLVTSIFLFVTWLIMNFKFLTAEQNGFIRFFLTFLFSLIILLRPKQDKIQSATQSSLSYIFMGLAGALSALCGIIFEVHQFEWLGLLVVLFTCLKWSLPVTCKKDIFLSLFLIYWAHPLPGTIFGPMQLAMQKISVTCSEWFLQILNVRVWADGFVLYTGLNTFEIPEWCSGMRTATTVFLLAIGLGVLNRLKWYECVIMVILSLFQAVVLNILRIVVMITLAPTTGSWSGLNFLHNTAGIIVLAAAFITCFEISYWKRKGRKTLPAGQETDLRKGHILVGFPPFWSWVLEHKILIVITMASIILVPGLIYKSRPSHKVEMIKDVASTLRDTGALETAEKAARVAQKLFPDDNDWNLTIVRLLIIRQKYEEALTELDRMGKSPPVYDLEKDILKSYSLMALQRMQEAVTLIQKFPEEVRNKDPRVTMILAEMAFHARKADDVAKYVVIASGWHPNISRIRALYPFLRAYRKWRAIANSDLPIPYNNSSQCLSAIEAYMNLNNVPVVASMTQQAMTAWPDDLRILEPLFFLALKRSEGKWENSFTQHFKKCVNAMNTPDTMHVFFSKCFQLGRPDLAWFLYEKIAVIDPTHPSLYMSAVTHGESWFTFRKRFLGISTPIEEEMIDLKSILLFSSSFPSWRRLFDHIPLAKELTVKDTIKVRQTLLARALKEFEKRNAAGKLSLSMQYEYAYALEKGGFPQKAIEIINMISSANPETKGRNISILAEIYERMGDWQNVYEILRNTPNSDNPDLSSLLRLCQAQLELKLNLAAFHTAKETVRRFPDAVQGIHGLVITLITLDSPEEALFILSKPRLRRDLKLDITEAEILFRTQRYKEAVEYCRTIFLPGMNIPSDARQDAILPAAEAALIWHKISIPSENNFKTNAVSLRKLIPSAKSPYMRKLMNLWIECYDKRCTANTDDLAKWLSCGRDNVEKAVALNQLTLLLCHENKFNDALNIAGKAVKYLPNSPLLWKILIGLSNADMKVINAARRLCPDDPDIWLAELVAKTKEQKPGVRSQKTESKQTGIKESGQEQTPWAEETVIRHFSEPSGNSRSTVVSTVFSNFPPATVARAGEYLLGKGYNKAAVMACHDAVKRARGLLPIYLLGIKCALIEKDKAWTADCTTQAIKASLHPASILYREMVLAKSKEKSVTIDNDILEALKKLRLDEPGNPLWAQMLGYVRFMRGGWESADALSQMTTAIDAGATNKIPFFIAAEAARQLGNHQRAADLLRKGLKNHPNDIRMLNNLVFTLAMSPQQTSTDSSSTLTPQQEALQMIPDLLSRAGNDLHILDTVAVAYIRSGKYKNAEPIITEILRQSENGSPLWFKAKLHLADIALKNGNQTEAESTLKEILRKSHGIPDEDIITANKLLMEISPMDPKYTPPKNNNSGKN
ncbi:MAG: archaeosortase/exosortase family protein [Kiritimatiellae bacterium]|nr:archaeosortase/exosortase family protein [Kiritimatiellia bacterium]MDD5520357.1 archaeosortase/exosortase family protein [Kiritimatiellia bacterium]